MDEFQAKLLEALDRIADEIGELKDEMVKNHEGLTTTLSTAMDLAEQGQRGQQDALKDAAARIQILGMTIHEYTHRI